MKNISYLIISILSFLLILFVVTKFTSSSYNFYQFQYKFLAVENNVYDRKNHTHEVIDYIKHKNELSDIFTPDEKNHMSDVRHLFDSLNIFISALAVLIAMLLFFKKIDPRVLKETAIRFFIYTIIALCCSLLFFSQFFELFHFLTFDNDLWLLPPDSLLIKLFPEEFFRNFFVTIFLISLTIYLSIVSFLPIAFKSSYNKNNKEKDE